MSGIDSDLIRGHIDTIILKTLFDGDKYGYEILDEVAKKSDGAYELKQPTLYSCLKRLETQGLISSYWVDSEIGGKRHYYCLTEQGKETYIENQKNWIRSRQIIDNLIWENAPVMQTNTINEKNIEETTNNENIVVSESININTNETTPVSNDETVITSETNIQEETEKSNLLESFINTDNENIEADEIETHEETSDESVDIMTLLGHFDNSEDKNIDSHIEKINEITENLNSIEESYSSNSFLENFVKNYMSNEEVDQASKEEITLNPENNEIIDDFDLDLSKHLDSNDSYFSATETNDKIDFITPNVVIDNLKQESTNEEYNHIEFLDDNQNSDIESNENFNNVTPTYVSYGEEIIRKQEDTNYSIIENNEDELVQSNNIDLDSLYINPEEKQDEQEYETITEFNNVFDETQLNIEEFNTNNDKDIFNNSEGTQINNNEDQEEIYRQIYSNQAQGFEVIPSKYTDDESKRKITELTTFAKESSLQEEQINNEENSFDTNEFLERNKASKNYDKLIAEFESEGLSVRVHKKLVKESKESRSYVETNKIKMTRNWISFCFISTILAIIFAVMKSSNVTYYAFSYKYFVIGILVSLIVPTISTIIYALNPYRKHVSSFSAGASFMLSFLIFIQLLLIIYCINLQLGFYSFKQEYYNHLYWIIPSIIAIYPIFNSIVYTTLFKSKNFHS